MGIYEYYLPKADGTEVSLKEYEGKVMLIVNTATGCGFTPQYKDLEKIYEEFHDGGLEIIDIPCNQFAGQAPESDEEIANFCSHKYNTQFSQFKKSEVNGENALPIYKYLKSQKSFGSFGKSPKALAMAAMLKTIDRDYKNNPEIKWNFTKFLVDREGNVIKRFEPTYSMKKVREEIGELI